MFCYRRITEVLIVSLLINLCLVSRASAQTECRPSQESKGVVLPYAYTVASKNGNKGYIGKIRLTISPHGATTDEESGNFVRVGFLEGLPYGLGDQWKMAAWSAVTTVILLGCDLSGTDVMFSIDDYVDGPSAGSMMALGLLVLLNGHEKAFGESRKIMTGTINPDGTIGPVEGIKAKWKSANTSGYTEILVPRMRKEDFESEMSGQPDGFVHVTETIEGALDSFVPDANSTTTDGVKMLTVLSEPLEQVVKDRLDDAKALKREVEKKDYATPTEFMSRVDALIKAARLDQRNSSTPNEEGKLILAYHKSLLAIRDLAAFLIGKNLSTTKILGLLVEKGSPTPSRVSDLEQDLSNYNGTDPAQMISVAHARAALRHNSLIASLGPEHTSEMMRANALIQSMKAIDIYRLMFQSQVKPVPGPSANPISSGSLSHNSAPRIRNYTNLFVQGLRANLGYLFSLDGNKNSVRDRLQSFSVGNASSLASGEMLQGSFAGDIDFIRSLSLAKSINNEPVESDPARDLLKLGSAVDLYITSSVLINKYYALKFQMIGNAPSFGNKHLLNAMLETAKSTASKRIGSVQSGGYDSTLLQILFYGGDQLMQSPTDQEKLEALKGFWQSSIYSLIIGAGANKKPKLGLATAPAPGQIDATMSLAIDNAN
jgi:hypothetical protein